jgi:uncharacterized protein YbjT (DUF2867 family)
MGAEIREICYKDLHSVKHAVRGAEYMVFFPEHDKDRVRQARKLVEAVKDEGGIRGTIVSSIRGADKGKKKLFRDYCEIERTWKECDVADCVCVLRPGVFQEVLHLWAPHVEDRGTINMIQSKDKYFAPLALCDYSKVIECILTKAHGQIVDQIDIRHHNQTYELTGPKAINGQELVRMINAAIDQEGRVKYEHVSVHELREYLEHLEYPPHFETEFDDVPTLSEGFNRAYKAIEKLSGGYNRKVEKNTGKFYDALDKIENAIGVLEEGNRGRNFNGYPYSRARTARRQSNRFYEPTRRNEFGDVFDLLDRLKRSDVRNLQSMTGVADSTRRELDRLEEEIQNLGFHVSSDHKYPRPPLPLQPIVVDCIVDYLQYVDTGAAGKVTDDVRKITHKEPRHVESWLKDNAREFVPRQFGCSHRTRRFDCHLCERRDFYEVPRSRI